MALTPLIVIPITGAPLIMVKPIITLLHPPHQYSTDLHHQLLLGVESVYPSALNSLAVGDTLASQDGTVAGTVTARAWQAHGVDLQLQLSIADVRVWNQS
jgi:hypothetical protein